MDTRKDSDIRRKMENPTSFDVLRNRLEKKHFINTEEWGHISINLPRFKKFIELWGSNS
ncbi:MAG: hypothetical protein ACI4S4_05500 [Candidatus Ornithospirochaeta sp.]